MTIGDPMVLLTNAHIVPYNTDVIEQETIKLTNDDANLLTTCNKFGFVQKDFQAFIKQCRNRQYDFLQMHGMHSFSFDKFMRIARMAQQLGASSRKSPIYLFYIGNLHLMSPNVIRIKGNISTIAIDAMHDHLLLLGGSNVRFKTDVCVRRVHTSVDGPINTKEEAEHVFERFHNTYAENIQKDFRAYLLSLSQSNGVSFRVFKW